MYRSDRRTRGHVRGWLPVFVVFVLFGVIYFGGSYVASPEPDIDLRAGMAFTRLGEQDVVVVQYTRMGLRGMAQSIVRDVTADRLAAISLGTGETLWDVQLADARSRDAGVLAAGGRYVYVGSDADLTIVRLDDGSVVARGAAVAGLGGEYIARYSAYGFDAGRGAVVAMDAGGGLHTIRLDATRAEPADAATARAWRGRVSADGSPSTVDGAVAGAAVVPGHGRVTLAVADGVPGARLRFDGKPLGDKVFHDAGIVLDQAEGQGTAIGTGHVVVQHAKGINDDTTVLSVVSLATGAVTASTEIGTYAAGRAVTAPGGRAVVQVTADVADESDLVVIGADGGLRRIRVGLTDFFGSPL
jgi:hypothetical protein